MLTSFDAANVAFPNGSAFSCPATSGTPAEMTMSFLVATFILPFPPIVFARTTFPDSEPTETF